MNDNIPLQPHSLILGSALATQDRVSTGPPKRTYSLREPKQFLPTAVEHRFRNTLDKFLASVTSAFRVARADQDVVSPLSHSDRENNSLPFVRAHLSHGIVDMIMSLLGFAVMINSLCVPDMQSLQTKSSFIYTRILILAAAVFYNGGATVVPASLFDAHKLIGNTVGKRGCSLHFFFLVLNSNFFLSAAALLFAISLLAAGQSSSIIATVAGQAVSEGFLQWRVSVSIYAVRLLSILSEISCSARRPTSIYQAHCPYPVDGSGYRCRPTRNRCSASCLSSRSVDRSPLYHSPVDLSHFV